MYVDILLTYDIHNDKENQHCVRFFGTTKLARLEKRYSQLPFTRFKN